jgi:hypothetical protein
MTESTRIFKRTSNQYILLKTFSRNDNVYALGGLVEDNIRCFLKTCEWQCFIRVASTSVLIKCLKGRCDEANVFVTYAP